jgi:hypothetical protein
LQFETLILIIIINKTKPLTLIVLSKISLNTMSTYETENILSDIELFKVHDSNIFQSFIEGDEELELEEGEGYEFGSDEEFELRSDEKEHDGNLFKYFLFLPNSIYHK